MIPSAYKGSVITNSDTLLTVSASRYHLPNRSFERVRNLCQRGTGLRLLTVMKKSVLSALELRHIGNGNFRENYNTLPHFSRINYSRATRRVIAFHNGAKLLAEAYRSGKMAA